MIGCGACGGAGASDGGAAPSFLTALLAEADFDRLSITGDGGDAAARTLKYVARIDGKTPVPGLQASCYFQNMNQFSWHLHFLQSFPEQRGLSHDAYRSLVLSRSTRRLWGGAVQRWPEARHPVSGDRGVFSYSVYAEAGGVDVQAIAEVDARLKACAPFASARLVFVPETLDQQLMVEREKRALTDAGISALRPADLLGTVSHVAYTSGEGYGYLRVTPRGQELETYGPRDVVIVESAPNDISIVAGLITQNPQSELGHVNLRLREKATPNASVPDIYENSQITALADQLVRVVVDATRFVIEPADPAAADAFWEERRPRVPAPQANLETRALTPLVQLRAADADAYGAKCANLGELTRVLEGEERPDGFGIPLVHYRDFMENTGLDVHADALLTADLMSNAVERRTALQALRSRIRAEKPDTSLLEAITQSIASVFGETGRNQFMRFRSSTNVEDLDAFTGAGLYDSRSGCLADDLDDDLTGPSKCLEPAKAGALEKQLAHYRTELAEHPERTYLNDLIEDAEEDLTKEKPVAEALIKVWASLWNERAFDERAYYGIDHRLAYMGVCVHPAYSLERINAVAVSNLHVDDSAPMYRLNSQVGELSVVRPEIPTAVSEVLTFRREGDTLLPSNIERRVGSSLVPEDEHVWPDAKLSHLAELLFRVHDHFTREVYSHRTPLSLDFEVKLTRDGTVVIKQVRPYVSIEP